MGKEKINKIRKCIGWGGIWLIVLITIAVVLSKFKGFLFNDVLFVEGIIFIMLGIFSTLEGNPLGLSLQSLGQSGSQYMSNANLEVVRMEKEKKKIDIKSEITAGTSTIAFLSAGIICSIISFIV